MYGAIIGDTVGSVYEWRNIKTKDFPFFQKRCFPTDDSFMTVAVAKACLKYADDPERDLDEFREVLVREMRRIGNLYPNKGYGGHFRQWLLDEDMGPYGSCGNGSAMRVSPCGWAADSLEEAEALAEASADVTHDHPDGIKGAKATAAAVYLARTGCTRTEIRSYLQEHYYPMDRLLKDIRPVYTFDGTCQGTVPEAIEAFLESTSFEDAVRNAISLGGDSDTLTAITGSIAEAYYGVPDKIRNQMREYLERDMRPYDLEIIREFRARFHHRFYFDVLRSSVKKHGPAPQNQFTPRGPRERFVWSYYHEEKKFGYPLAIADPAVCAIKGVAPVYPEQEDRTEKKKED